MHRELMQPELLLARLVEAQAALSVGNFTQGLALAEALNEDAMTADAWEVAAEAALVVAKIQCNRQCPEEVERWAERAMAAGRLQGSGHAEAVAWVVLASSRAAGDQAGPAMLAVDAALSRVHEHMPRDVRRAVFTGIAMAYDALGMPQPGLQAARLALQAVGPEVSMAVRSRTRVNLMYGGLSVVSRLQDVGDPGAQPLLDELLSHVPLLQAESAAVGTSHARAAYCHTVGQLMAVLGRLDEARALLTELQGLHYDAHASVRRNVCIALARVEARRGDVPAAAAAAAQAQSFVDAATHTPPSASDLNWLAELAELQGNWPRAVALLKRRHSVQSHKMHSAFESRVAELTAQVAQHSLRLENAELRQRNAGLTATFESLQDQALTDPLTRLVNRRGLEQAFAALSSNCQTLTLVMLDLDHFKSINDRHSHVVGDEVLRRLATLMHELLRAPDLLARYGGEEFTLLLVDVPEAAALRAVERLRSHVASHEWASVGVNSPVTLSGGLVQVRPGESLPSAVARADVFLYQAKAKGRNRVLAPSQPH